MIYIMHVSGVYSSIICAEKTKFRNKKISVREVNERSPTRENLTTMDEELNGIVMFLQN